MLTILDYVYSITEKVFKYIIRENAFKRVIFCFVVEYIATVSQSQNITFSKSSFTMNIQNYKIINNYKG